MSDLRTYNAIRAYLRQRSVEILITLSGVPTSRTVNGHALSSNVTVTKSDVGLGSADNTSDTGKPVSTAQQTAIDAKVADTIANGVTTVAPSQNAVFDALALKQPLDADLTALAGLTGVEGDILYRDATQWQRLPKGTAGQTLKMNAGATAPEWVT